MMTFNMIAFIFLFFLLYYNICSLGYTIITRFYEMLNLFGATQIKIIFKFPFKFNLSSDELHIRETALME